MRAHVKSYYITELTKLLYELLKLENEAKEWSQAIQEWGVEDKAHIEDRLAELYHYLAEIAGRTEKIGAILLRVLNEL